MSTAPTKQESCSRLKRTYNVENDEKCGLVKKRRRRIRRREDENQKQVKNKAKCSVAKSLEKKSKKPQKSEPIDSSKSYFKSEITGGGDTLVADTLTNGIMHNNEKQDKYSLMKENRRRRKNGIKKNGGLGIKGNENENNNENENENDLGKIDFKSELEELGFFNEDVKTVSAKEGKIEECTENEGNECKKKKCMKKCAINKEDEEEEEEEKPNPLNQKNEDEGEIENEDEEEEEEYFKRSSIQSPVYKYLADTEKSSRSNSCDRDGDREIWLNRRGGGGEEKEEVQKEENNNNIIIGTQEQILDKSGELLPLISAIEETATIHFFNSNFAKLRNRLQNDLVTQEENNKKKGKDGPTKLKKIKGIDHARRLLEKHIACPVLNPLLFSNICFPNHYLCIGGQQGNGKRIFVREFCRKYGVNMIHIKPLFTSAHYIEYLVKAAVLLQPCVLYFDQCDYELMESNEKSSWARQLNMFFTSIYEDGKERNTLIWAILGLFNNPGLLARWINDRIKDSFVIIEPPTQNEKAHFMRRECKRLWNQEWEGDMYGNFIIKVATSYSPFAGYGDILIFLKAIYFECVNNAFARDRKGYRDMAVGTVHILPSRELIETLIQRLEGKELIASIEAEKRYRLVCPK